MKITRRTLFMTFGAAAAVTVAAAAPIVHLSANERLLAIALRNVSSVLDADPGRAQPLRTTLDVVRADGLPKEVRGARVDLAISAPEHLRAGTIVDKERIELARNGQELWVWQPAKNFAVVGAAGLQRFKNNPDSIDGTKLGPLGLKLPIHQLPLLPHLAHVERLDDEELEGSKCHVLRVTQMALTQRLTRWPKHALTLWVRQSDSFPIQIAYEDGKEVNALLALRDAQFGKAIPAAEFQLAAPEGTNVERVALSHLTRFVDNGLGMLRRQPLPTLGPVTGEKRLVATSGEGRLEIHDGTRVLFLKGTPEEMGRQHGTLMRKEIQNMVPRILYGVGVGSSFSKGSWFFGTIEACEERIAKFVDPRHLREMDAIAQASGFASEEIRLANFFPELFHCSGFAIMGDATEGRRIYHGRILDYMKGVGLEASAVVIVSQPEEGKAWVNLTYSGFVGSVTAMNEAQISIGEMGGRGEGNWDGKPMAQLVREVMERAGTLEEAVEIMRSSPRTCEYYYVIADGKTHDAVGIKATPELFEVVRPGEAHPQLDTPVKDTVLLSAGDRYQELVRRVQDGYGKFDAESARELMTRPVCMSSNIQSVLFAPDTLDFWVANADSKNVASHTRYTKYNLREFLSGKTPPARRGPAGPVAAAQN